MNTLARQSISKTLVKACTAAVLLVTCLNTQASDSTVETTFANFGSETLASIKADAKTNTSLQPNLDYLTQALERSEISQDFRNETLNSINAEINNGETFAPSLDALSAALDKTDFNPDSDTMQVQQNNAWSSTENIYPSIASLGNIEFEVRDTASREATMIALDFAIEALASAKTNLVLGQSLTL